jgi:hypothetical protein
VQGNAQFQTLVILDPSAKVAWKELEFGPELEAALRNYKLTVDVDIAPGRGSNHKLKVFGTPVTPEARIAAHSKIKTTKSAEKALKKAAVGDAPAVAGKALLFQLRSYIQSAGNMRNPVEMGSLLKDLTEVQKIVDLPEPSTVEKDPEFNTEPTTTPEPQDQQTVAQDQYAAPQVDQTQQTQPAVPPAPTGMPGQMTSIAPAGQTVVSPDNYYNQQNYNTQDLNRMRKNAGIVVE